MGEAAKFLQAQGLCVPGRLDSVSFELSKGSTLAIVGPSGSGKTTLLRLMAGFEAPASGELRLDGETVSRADHIVVPAQNRRLAYAFQEPALMPHMSVADNVMLGWRGVRSQRLAAAQKALGDVGLPGFEHRRVWSLSGGEAQRVQLARALAANAKILLLDEPFASVDRMCRADLLSRVGSQLKRCAAQGFAAIVTHDPADAMELADQTVMMDRGRVVAFGTFAEIAQGTFGPWPAQFLAAGLAGRALTQPLPGL